MNPGGGGFGNVLKESDKHEVDLFQPSITLDKTGDELSKVGDSVEAKIVNIDRKNRGLGLSIKAKDYDEEKAAIATYSSDAASAGTTAFGDLLKDAFLHHIPVTGFHEDRAIKIVFTQEPAE